LIIIQENDKIADEERQKFLDRIKGNDIAPTIEVQAKQHSIEVVDVPHHNKEDCLKHLERVKPNLLVLGGTRIIRDKVLAFPRDAVINAHPGLLPECRGSASPAWSVYHDIKVGSSCHICAPGIDTGDILARREIGVKRGMTYEDLCYLTLVLSGTLMTEVVKVYSKSFDEFTKLRVKQGESTFPTFKNAPPEILEEVRKKLSDQKYKHYID